MTAATLERDPAAAYRHAADDVLAALATDARRGLSHDEARARLEGRGRNELQAEKPVPAWRNFLAQFADVLVILLIVAAGVSALLWIFEIDGALRAELVRTLAAADRANNAVLQERGGRWTVQGDPTEGALIVAARKAGLENEALDGRFARVAEVPFSSERKLMSTIHTDAEATERLLAFTKGAPDVLLPRCSKELVGETVRPMTEERRREIAAANETLAGEALRTLAVAFRSLPRHGIDVPFLQRAFSTSRQAARVVTVSVIGPTRNTRRRR